MDQNEDNSEQPASLTAAQQILLALMLGIPVQQIQHAIQPFQNQIVLEPLSQSSSSEVHPLSDEEVKWVRMAIQSEADRAAFRKAVIEKTFAALVGAGFLAAIGWIGRYIAEHWKA